MAVHVWICRHCGKRSYAKRDPIAHKRLHRPEGAGKGQGWFVWCGPFDRYVAELDTSKPQRPELPHFGTPVDPREKQFALAPDDPEAPF